MFGIKVPTPILFDDIIGQIVIDQNFKPYRVKFVSTFQDPNNGELQSVVTYEDVEAQMDREINADETRRI